jgi:hypothetical protein
MENGKKSCALNVKINKRKVSCEFGGCVGQIETAAGTGGINYRARAEISCALKIRYISAGCPEAWRIRKAR